MNKLKVKLGDIELNNPVLCASGCLGHGYEVKDYTDLSKIGAVTIKTVTLMPRKGNPTPRIHEIHSGIMSSIGLQNPGIEVYIEEVMPKVQEVLRADQLFFSIAGGCEDDYIRLADRVLETYNKTQIAALEVNTACPNVQKGAGAIGKDRELLSSILTKLVKMSDIPVICKINTDFDAFCDSAKTAEAAGVQSIYTTNTPVGMAIDIRTGKPCTGMPKAPLNGPVIKPIGVGKTFDLYHAVKIPIIASGGVCCMEDVIEYMMAGASAVGIGAYNFVDPDIAVKIIRDLENYVEEQKLESISDIVGLTSRILSR